jgi:cytochrome c553
MSWLYPAPLSANLPQLPPAPFQVVGSPKTLTPAEMKDDFNPPDWFPGEHPTPPAIVAHAPAGGPMACGACHLVAGVGSPGAPNLAGLPAPYILSQLKAFAAGDRQSAYVGAGGMAEEARAVSAADAKAAADYFASLPSPGLIHVVEAAQVPLTSTDKWGWFVAAPGAGRTPINGRIVQVPQDVTAMLLNDPHLRLTAYVPPGALARGQALAASGGLNGAPCAACHGQGLRGQGDAPPLAGRDPLYLGRALWDIKTGARHGLAVAPMHGPANGLTEDDIRDLAAYLASLKP